MLNPNLAATDCYETFVVKNPQSNEVPREAAGGEVTAWAKGHALEEKDKLECFIRSLAYGELEDPVCAAGALMDEMGWG